MSGSFSLFGAWAEEAGAKNCKKIKNKKKRKKCLARTAPTCTPQCAGKTCGDDGCGGSCGPCFRGTCQGGVCVCPSGQEICNGVCESACAQFELRDPDTCRCCGGTGQPCGLGTQCCSGICGNSGGFKQCQGRNGLEACTFGEQCRTGVCEAGKCTCDGQICKGICHVPCSPTRATLNPITCACCVKNGSDCISGTCECCCSGTCATGGVCTGLHDGADCDFDAQCASGNCLLSFDNGPGSCFGGVIGP